MGKDKTGNRTKNNLRPSSSGRSAEMLGTAPINPFMSFTTLKESMGVDDQMSDSHLDPNFQVVLKKMNKKDGVTKLKALQEFSQLCASSEPEQVVAILPFWPRLYSLLALDVEHRVREASHVAHRSVILKVKRNIAPYLKQLAGPWFVAQCDTYAPAASAASLAFNEAFPPKKLAEAIAFCQEEILSYIYENLIVHTPQTMCNAKTMSPEEIESKYLRTVISSLQGYGLYLTRLTSDQLQSAKELNQKLVSDAKFWKFSKHQSPQVRSAWFSALVALCQHAQFLILGEEKRVGQSVFGSLDESEATVLPVVWEAALVALVAMDGLLEAVSFEKLVLPKLLRVCREGGKGSAAVIFPSLLPLLSKLPSAVVKDSKQFHGKFFGSIQQGFSQRSVHHSSSESKAVASAFVECLQYVIQLNQDDETLGVELLQEYLLPCLCQSIQTCKRLFTCDALYTSVSKLLHSWGRCSEGTLQRKLLHSFCRDLSAALHSIAFGEDVKFVCQEGKANENEGQEEEHRESTEENTSKQEKPALKHVLQSQVDFITSLLEKQNRPMKVKFADVPQENSEDRTPEECKIVVSEVTEIELLNLGKSLCCCYLQAVIKSECLDYLPPLASLIKVVSTPTIYSDLAKGVNVSSETELFSKYFINWLKPQNTVFCRDIVSISIPLLGQLPHEHQERLFSELLKDGLNEKQLLWLVEESVSNNDAAASWLRSPHLAPVLKEKAEEAIQCDNISSTWKLLSSGFDFAGDGDHIFCHLALENIMDLIVSHLKSTWETAFVVPRWTAAASEILVKLYHERSPFLRSLSSPQRALSLAFEICLSEPIIPVDEEALEKVWKGGVRGLARMHGHASQTVLYLCSSFVDSILGLLLKKPLHPKEVLVHTASQLAQLVEIVTDCFSSVDGEDQRREVCSLLLSTLFSEHPHDSEEGGVSQLKDILALQHCGLESLADCVDPFHIGTDSSQNIPRSSMTELVGVGYWGIIEAFVLHQLSSIPSFDNLIACDESFYSLDLFLDMFILLSDVAYIAQHFPFTELGNALLQLTQDYTNTLATMILNMSPSNGQKIHDHLRDRAVQVAAYKRAHRYWHTFSSALPSGYYKCVEAALPVCSTNDPLKDLDLSPLDEFSAKLLDEGLVEALKTQTISWLNLLYDFQMRHSERLLGDGSIDTCTISMIQDTLRIMKFRCAVLSCAPDLFSGKMWDQVMISMATWIHSAYESLCGKPVEDTTVRYSRKLCALTSELCKLFVSFYQVIAKLENGTIDLVDPERGSMKESLPREWQDVFAGECEHRIFVMWTDVVENLKPSEESPPIVALLNYLGGAIQISSTRFLQSSQDAEITYEPLLQLAPHYLLHNLFSVRLTAFYLLMKIVPSLVKHDAASFANISNAGDDGENLINSEERLSLLKFENILSQAQTVVSTMLSDLKIGSSCTVQPLTDAYTYTTGYLLIWSIILKMCKEAETELMCQYAMWLKNSSENYAETFLLNVFRLLPQQAFDENVKRTLEFFSKDKDTEILFGACWTSAIVEHLACNALYGILSTLPALTRQWWTNAEPKSASLIDKVVSKHFSPHICEAEMSAVAKMQDKAVENMSVRVHTNVREVVATYTVDDLVMELVVRLPTNHPLSPMIVEIGKRNAAAAVQWRQWLMQLTMFLTHQNGTLWDGLALWRNNVVRKYEGVEECYICFCVLSGANFQLPKLSCRTCRKKFHSTCLYKWFQTSNKSTCPICRNLF